uniref:Uncharacterized protein n=1 Tax=Branchiostoma floridae TaxID=7739 RepID=C3Y612_BRAFL|eukprot:XP_002608399.1 hypothetical protein BRAFLDRAFT_95409 [Branchiostoma floridae]
MLSWLKKANPSLQRPTPSPGRPNPVDKTSPSKQRPKPSPELSDAVDTENLTLEPPTFPGLPNPLDTEDPWLTAAANREVEKALTEFYSRKRKRTSYGKYTPETRAKIARLAMEIGAQKTAVQMSEEVGKQLSESTVRSIRKSYEKEVKRQGTDAIASFPRKNVGPRKSGRSSRRLAEVRVVELFKVAPV